MKILKFGGASIGSAEKIQNIISIVKADIDRIRVVVVSAFNGVTDSLIEAGKRASNKDDSYLKITYEIELLHSSALDLLIPVQHRAHLKAELKSLIHELEDVLKGSFLVGECSLRTLDYVMSFGERLSAFIVAEAFKVSGVDAEFLDARSVILTDSNFGAAKVLFQETDECLRSYFADHLKLQVMTGFIAATLKGETTTFGRGGSDYSASIVGAMLDVDIIEIWTDVSGVMTADPRYVPRALSVPALTYEEAMELSHFGAKVIYPPTIQPAYKKGIPLLIKNAFKPEFSGTLISSETAFHTAIVTGVSSIDKIGLLRVEGTGMIGVAGIARRVFGVLAERKINIILITQASSEYSICFAVLPERARDAQAALNEDLESEIERGLIDGVYLEEDYCVVSAVGENMRYTPGISGRLFSALGRNGVNIAAIAQGSSELSISVVVAERDKKKALQSIHDEFFLSDVKAVHVFLVGKGRVAAALLRQLDENHAILKKEEALDIRLLGFRDSKRTLFDEGGIELKIALEKLAENGVAAESEDFVKKLVDLNLPHTIFVDCTASPELPMHYPFLLSNSISIVTPNKHSVASSYDHYKKIEELLRRRRGLFLYETCVGAGLPVISTLSDLLKSGDRILRIDAVLSGTLSFLFNTFKAGRFSEVLREAHRLGYTEPDPREDMGGKDVGRKLLILARKMGLALDFEDLSIENLVPESCRGAQSTEEFFSLLEREDPSFEARVSEAAKDGKRLCYIASIENGKAKTGLEAIGSEHPFFGLSGSDNVIAFTTQRYATRPLVVKGPGAGPEVTAAGVFADIIRIAKQI